MTVTKGLEEMLSKKQATFPQTITTQQGQRFPGLPMKIPFDKDGKYCGRFGSNFDRYQFIFFTNHDSMLGALRSDLEKRQKRDGKLYSYKLPDTS